jgi:DnaK suppressor protein
VSPRPPIEPERARTLLSEARERGERSLARIEQGLREEHEEVETATDPVDDGAQLEEEEIDEALRERLRAELDAIARAEERLESGTYGFSIESGEPIPAERLEAVPWAERTKDEQARYEGL